MLEGWTCAVQWECQACSGLRTTADVDASHPSFSLLPISSHRLEGLLIQQQQQQQAIIIELPVNKLIKGKFPLSTPAVTEICHTRSSCTIQFVIHHHYADYPNNKLLGHAQLGNLRCCIETGWWYYQDRNLNLKRNMNNR